MGTRILFATETIKTSQGWFDAGQLLPKDDLPELEVVALVDSKQAGWCMHDSPLAKLVHETRTTINKQLASFQLKDALGSVSADSPSTPEPLIDAEENEASGSETAQQLELNKAIEEKEAAQKLADKEAAAQAMLKQQKDGGKKVNPEQS